MSLWITADDYGLSAAANRAIEEVADASVLSAVSVMAHGGADLDGIQRLRRTGVALGLHLVFTRERPAAPDGLRGTPLLDEDGRLPGSWLALFGILARRPRLSLLLRREAEAQFARFNSIAGAPAFINGHEHVHLHHRLWPMVAELVERAPGAGVRIAHEQRLRGVRQGAVALASKAAWRLRPMLHCSIFSPLGIDYAERLDRRSLSFALAEAEAVRPPSIPELVVHPAHERALLLGDDVRALLRRHRGTLA